MESNTSSLSQFHPVLTKWFLKRFGKPTEIQTKAWELISEGEHCLITAATGSGKTLAAFLWSISQIASGAWDLGQTRVVYVSPLKALNNDIRRNLLGPLGELEALFKSENVEWPNIRVLTRSGDTEQSARRKMLRNPPEILITTPESLNLLLTSKAGQRSLLGVKSVILDEIHSVVGGKRGVYLMTAVERLAHLCGEFQRIALSATVRPMDKVAAYFGGFLDGKPRDVKVARSELAKHYDISVRFPIEGNDKLSGDEFWQPIVQDLKSLIAENSSTLVFVNSRKLCEKIAYKINEGEATPIAYSHHGSLSKEIRFAVEQRLKNGELSAIIATNSLEMGIDIGSLDCVVMVQCPGLISSAVQKVGRAGHQVGAKSKALLFPSHSRDFVEAAVLSKSIRKRAIEAIKPVEAPLDVLAQIIVSILGTGPWDLQKLFDLIRCSYPYRKMERETFDLVVAMLAGRYSGSRLRELKARVSIDQNENTVTLRKGALLAYYFSGGVIPDRGYFQLKLSGNGGKVGELDEEFVWERKIGDVFTLGVQSWRIDQINHNDVLVSPSTGGEVAPPFWRAETFDRDFHFSNRIGEFLEWANEASLHKDFAEDLRRNYRMDTHSSRALVEFLTTQRQVTNCDLPHRHHILVEVVDSAPGGAPGTQLIMHTHWGGRVNRPYAMALDAAWLEAFGHRTEVYVNNDCVVAVVTEEVSVDEVLGLVNLRNVDALIRTRLEGSGFFGARFREAAGISLLVTRSRAGQRLPLWLSRMKAKKLFESVQAYDDFPLLLEAWRSCLKDEFDMESLRIVLGEMELGEIAVSVARGAKPSPFAASVAWRQINDEYMYATDQPESTGSSRLREDLVSAVAFDPENRPSIDAALSEEFERKRQRTAAGYMPDDGLELKEYLRDRIAVPQKQWLEFSSSIATDFAVSTSAGWVYLLEEKERFSTLFSLSPNADTLVEFLSHFGAVKEEQLQEWIGCDRGALSQVLDELAERKKLVRGVVVDGETQAHVCEVENFEALLRMKRARSRVGFSSLPVDRLPLFLASWQGLLSRSQDADRLRSALDLLVGWVAKADEWDAALLKSRTDNYRPDRLDSLIVEDGVLWYGREGGKFGFCLPEDWELIPKEDNSDFDCQEKSLLEVLDSGGRYSFTKLLELLGIGGSELETLLWRLVGRGRVSNDVFSAVRKGAAGGYELCSSARQDLPGTRRSRSGRRSRVVKPVLYPGNWYMLPSEEKATGPIEGLDAEKERARIVLDRYGVVFRELLQREQAGFRWKDTFRALRIMELSGEIVGGRFFDGVAGLQFVSKEALRKLKGGFLVNEFYWLSATDPASLCGVSLEGLSFELPKRVSSTRLIFRGSRLVCESQRNGKSLFFHVQPEDPNMVELLSVLSRAIGLNIASQIKLDTVNGEDARNSPYLEVLNKCWRLVANHKEIVLEGVKPVG